ncbi:MAG: hypothetical protein H6684_11270 [Deltaproteobacteria bacterium]|nr:hypothetical protein [Deltaproteobacteria bacterium]MCB9478318.1 hypothetical protein [Deltaproteobacteria bacterium]MCB9489302.1 hypothetical protein [Deltaproteobacteria bacterium]
MLVPDERIPEPKGLKVKCPSCAHIFRVHKPQKVSIADLMAESEPPAPGVGQPEFIDDDEDTPPETRMAEETATTISADSAEAAFFDEEPPAKKRKGKKKSKKSKKKAAPEQATLPEMLQDEAPSEADEPAAEEYSLVADPETAAIIEQSRQAVHSVDEAEEVAPSEPVAEPDKPVKTAADDDAFEPKRSIAPEKPRAEERARPGRALTAVTTISHSGEIGPDDAAQGEAGEGTEEPGGFAAAVSKIFGGRKAKREDPDDLSLDDLGVGFTPQRIATILGVSALVAMIITLMIANLNKDAASIRQPDAAKGVTPPPPVAEKAEAEPTPNSDIPLPTPQADKVTESTLLLAKGLAAERLATGATRKEAGEYYNQALGLAAEDAVDIRVARARLAMMKIKDAMRLKDAKAVEAGCADVAGLSEAVQATRHGQLAAGWCALAQNDADGALAKAQAVAAIGTDDELDESDLTETQRAELERQSAEGYILEAAVYEAKNDKAREIEALKAAAAKDRLATEAYLHLARIYEKDKKWREAFEAASAAVLASPSHPDARSSLDAAQAQMAGGVEKYVVGESAELGSDAEKREAYDKHMERAATMRRGGNYYGALGQLMQADKLVPGLPETTWQMGWIYLDLKKIYAANDAFLSLKAMGDARAWYGLGAAAKAKGDAASAKSNLEKFLEEAPDSPLAEEVRGVLNNLSE